MKIFRGDEFVEQKEEYFALDGQRLFLFKHPVSLQYQGVREEELDDLREDFALFIKEGLLRAVDRNASRPEKLSTISRFLFHLLKKSPPLHPWLGLPADSRKEKNSSTIAYHAILVSAFACSMARAWVLGGKRVEDLLRFQTPKTDMELPVDLRELIDFIRIASFCHDFGKHPPQRHHERGREQVREIFSGLLDEIVVFSLSEVAYRHHTGPSYRKKGESPIGALEELIAHADTLASATDRPENVGTQEDPVDSVSRFFREEFGDERALSLISADTDRVKQYIFESAKLPEVRGGSALLTELNERGISEILWENYILPPESLLYAAGGSALIVVPTSLARDIATSIQTLYLNRAKLATISVVHRSFLPKEWVQGLGTKDPHFGNLVKWLGYELRRAKEGRCYYPFYPSPPHARRCDSCEVRPAEKIEIDLGGEELFFCSICKEKRDLGRDTRSEFLRRFEEEFLNTELGVGTPYSLAFQQVSGKEKVHVARDLQEIGSGAEGRASGYVGLIYADGNDIGRRIQRAKTPAEYRTLSEELIRITELSTFKAMASQPLMKQIVCSDGHTRWVHPFEIVAMGGDDVFLIVPGDVALEIALLICEEFEKQFSSQLTMSAGVLIIHKHFPIYYARDIVEMLLKSAKKAGRKDGTNVVPSSYIDFQVVTNDSSLSEDLNRYRNQFYSGPGLFKNTHRLIQRPFQIEALHRLLEAARWARNNIPSSQLFQLRQAVAEHVPAWGKNWYRYQLAREGKDGPWWKFHQILFGKEVHENPEAPWLFSHETGWTTPVVDLIEILDFVRKAKGGERNETRN
ncbi:MAG: type III-B CRISPR-associated protein Cas10/Cmr2 [Treponemataceae bacterium]|nr:type III-B CRISPR-associated protein Cas10/Cmr2 [Treponemataceae bacterium]